MKREKGRKYDGRSRPSNETYKNNWNAIFLKDKNLWTVAVGINTVFIDDFNADWGVIAASSVIAATPIAVLFIFFQKQITGGLTAGSVKG